MSRLPIALLAVLSLLPCPVSWAAPVPIPTSYRELTGTFQWLEAQGLGGSVDVPDWVLDLPKASDYMQEPGSYAAVLMIYAGPGCSSLVTHVGLDMVDMTNTNDTTLRGDLLDGHMSVHGIIELTYPGGDDPGVQVYVHNSANPIWVSECVPVRVDTVAACSIADTQILLDHQTTALGDVSTATSSATVSCTAAGSGYLALPSGGDTILVGSGVSTLSTDAGDLSTKRPFAKGSTPIEIRSTLTGVGPGVWEGSTVIILVMD
jgi:hypothetical protein